MIIYNHILFSQSPIQYQHRINMVMLIFMYNALPLFLVQVSFNLISIFLSLSISLSLYYNLFLLHFFLLFCQKTILFIKWFLAHLEWFFGLFKSHVYYIVIRFADAYADGINKMCYSQISQNTQQNIIFFLLLWLFF